MYQEVEDWLYSIGLPELYSYFIEDGFTSLDSIRRMRQSDIDAIVDRKGYMIVLNEEIDKLNYLDGGFGGHGSHGSRLSVPPQAPRAGSYADSEADYETRESLMNRYDYNGVPAVGFASRQLARRAKSRSRKNRGSSMAPGLRSSVDRYVPNSAVEAYEAVFSNRRAISVAADAARNADNSTASALLEERQRRRDEERQRRAKTEMNFGSGASDGLASENLDRTKFRDHYANDYVWVEKNHITDVGVKYDGLSRKVDHKPSHWRCEDEIERGKEFKRMNDECADKIADNRYSIENSRDWLVDDGGICDRVHRMSARTLQTRYDLDKIRRDMENLKSMRNRLLRH